MVRDNPQAVLFGQVMSSKEGFDEGSMSDFIKDNIGHLCLQLLFHKSL